MDTGSISLIRLPSQSRGMFRIRAILAELTELSSRNGDFQVSALRLLDLNILSLSTQGGALISDITANIQLSTISAIGEAALFLCDSTSDFSSTFISSLSISAITSGLQATGANVSGFVIDSVFTSSNWDEVTMKLVDSSGQFITSTDGGIASGIAFNGDFDSIHFNNIIVNSAVRLKTFGGPSVSCVTFSAASKFPKASWSNVSVTASCTIDSSSTYASQIDFVSNFSGATLNNLTATVGTASSVIVRYPTSDGYGIRLDGRLEATSFRWSSLIVE
jgi:hypothetical protein